MQPSNISTIGRPVDPKYPTNLAIAALTAAVTVAGVIWQVAAGVSLLPSVLWGVQAGLAFFLAWALGRELDPDYALSAFIGAALSLVGLLFFDLPSLLILFWLLVATRIVNRTVGLPAGIADTLLLLGLAGWLTWQGNWGVGLATALAFWLDSQFIPVHRRHLPFAGLMLLLTVLSFVINGWPRMSVLLSPSILLVALTISVLFVIVIVTSQQVVSRGDRTGAPLNARRVQAAQALAVAAGLLVLLGQGDAGLSALLPLWAAALGTALYRIFALLQGGQAR